MAHIVSHHTVVRDGWHNMCSDLCFWNDTFWLVYDRTSAHSAPDGVVVLMRSADLRRWDEVAVFKTPHDARDAKLAATDDELFMFCADSNYETINGKVRQVAHSYISVSSDGYEWSTPTQICDRNYWLWRVHVHDGTFYCAEKGGDLLSSSNGRNWQVISRIPESEGESAQQLQKIRAVDHRTTPRFNEADLIFRPDGALWCVSRTKREPEQHALLYVANPPYEEWSCIDLKALIHCPALCESGGQVYVAGRRDPKAPWVGQHTPAGNTGIFRLDKSGLTPILALPSDGDAAYPGMLSLEENRLIISYYSQHAYLSGVIEGDKRRLHHIERWASLRREAPPPDYPHELSYFKSGPTDIFVAEIDLVAEEESRAL